MIFQLSVEMAPMLDIFFLHFLKLGCSGLLLHFGALAEIEFESRCGCVDFLACWQKEDEIPLFLEFCCGINSETASKFSQG